MCGSNGVTSLLGSGWSAPPDTLWPERRSSFNLAPLFHFILFIFLQQRSHKSKGNKFSPRRQQESGVTNKAIARRFASSISWPAAHLHVLLRTVGLIRSDIWITKPPPPQKKVSLFGPTLMIVVLPSYGIKISANMEPDMEVGVCFCRSYKPHLFQHHAA